MGSRCCLWTPSFLGDNTLELLFVSRRTLSRPSHQLQVWEKGGRRRGSDLLWLKNEKVCVVMASGEQRGTLTLLPQQNISKSARDYKASHRTGVTVTGYSINPASGVLLTALLLRTMPLAGPLELQGREDFLGLFHRAFFHQHLKGQTLNIVPKHRISMSRVKT